MKNQDGFIKTALLVLVVLTLIGAGFYFVLDRQVTSPTYVPNPNPVPVTKQTEVQVIVSSVPGKTQYEYKVHNTREHPVIGILIGEDRLDKNQREPELRSFPVGWDFNLEGSGNISSPIGWIGKIETQEESDNLYLNWGRKEGKGISQGETLGGFLITLNSPDDTYRTAHFTLFLNNGGIVSGVLQQ